MPPKGWRKNAEGQYPQPVKETEIVSIDDILFPRATVQKIAKNATNSTSDDNMILAKDSLLAVQRSSTVFVSQLLYYARQIAKQRDRKVVNAQDILSALQETEFGGFIPDLKQKLSAFENNAVQKRKQKVTAKANAKAVEEDDEHATKRLKDNQEQTVLKEDSENADDEKVTDAEDDDDDIFEDANSSIADKDVEDIVEDQDDEEEIPKINPIAMLDKEENELDNQNNEDDIQRVSSSEEDED